MKTLTPRTSVEKYATSFSKRARSKAAESSVVGFSETPSHHLVRFDMPEFLGDHVSVEILGDELVVKGRDSSRKGAEDREVSLKLDTDRPGVFARYRDGVLIVALPKADLDLAA